MKALKTWLTLMLLVGASLASAEPDTFFLGTGRSPLVVAPAGTELPNSYAKPSADIPAGAGSLAAIPVDEVIGFSNGQLVLFIQTKGDVPDTSPIDLDTLTDAGVGRWEFARLKSPSGVVSNNLYLEKPLVHAYVANRTQIVTVPEYDFVYVPTNGHIKASSWDKDKRKGGVLAFLVRGALVNEGEISADGVGFQGAEANKGTGNCSSKKEGERGEGLDDESPGNGQLNKASGGGGGECNSAGAGGGGNGGQGGHGGYEKSSPTSTAVLWGYGGSRATYGGSPGYGDLPGRLILGGGGGAGHGNPGAAGGVGGGAIFIRAASLSGGGRISADGLKGTDLGGGAGGGGAGGTILLRVAGRVEECPEFSAKGGAGGNSTGNSTGRGPGGGGGGGRIFLQGQNANLCFPVSPDDKLMVKGGDPGSFAVTGIEAAEKGADGELRKSIVAMTYPGEAVVLSVTPTQGGFVSDRRPTVTVRALPGRKVYLRFDNGNAEVTPLTETVGPPPGDYNHYTGKPAAMLSDATHSVVAFAEYDSLRSPESYPKFQFQVDATAPNTIINTLTPEYPVRTKARSVEFSFVAMKLGSPDVEEIGATFKCSFDNATWSSCAQRTTYGDATLGEGVKHTLYVKAVDSAGNEDTSPDDFSWEFDWTAPAAPVVTPLPPAYVNNNRYTFRGTVEGDARVYVYIDDVLKGTATKDDSTNWSFTPPEADKLGEGRHWIRVKAEDVAGNQGLLSNTVFFTVDTLKPGVDITSPTELDDVPDNTLVVLGTAEPGSFVELQLDKKDGSAVFGWTRVPGLVGDPATGVAGDPGTWRHEVTMSLDDATYVLLARATDAAGNVTETPVRREFTLDRILPNTTVTGSLPDSTPKDCSAGFFTNADSLNFSFGSSEPGVSYECVLDGDFGVTMPLETCPTSLEKNPLSGPSHPDAKYTLRVRAKDKAGNFDPSPAACTWTWDKTPPTALSLPVKPAEVTDSTLAVFQFSANDTLSSPVEFECVLDPTADKPFVHCDNPYILTVTKRALPYVLKFRAKDRAGNFSVTEVTHEWTVDTELPVPLIFPGEGASNPTNARSATLKIDLKIENEQVDYFYTRNGSESDPNKFLPVDTVVDGQGIVTISLTEEGVYELLARAYDRERKIHTPPELWAYYEWEVDWTPPKVEIAEKPETWVRFPTASFVFTAPGEEVKNVKNFLCTISDCSPMELDPQDCSDGIPRGGRASYQIESGLQEGLNCIRVWAQDLAGNLSEVPATYEWNLDTHPPEPPVINSIQGQLTVATRFPALDGVSEPFSDVAVLLDNETEPVVRVSANDKGRWQTRIPQEVEDGSHTLRTVAWDRAGNESAVSEPITLLVDSQSPAQVIGGGVGCSSSGGTGGSLLGLLGLARLLVRSRSRRRA
ncbi:adventurous gliding motility protein AgmC [Archangium violaceum]|uniref:adventurous gliding motility protein AgmC n=1 Tax=Archangium violaceum TaxID=83451 RepID=UPI0036DAA82B